MDILASLSHKSRLGDDFRLTAALTRRMADEDTAMIDGGDISDSSSFYGDDDTKARFEHLASSFSPKDYYSVKRIIPTVEARESRNEQIAAQEKASKLWSPGEGSEAYRQLSESPADFVRRMAPTSRAAAGHPWLWVYNPHLGQGHRIFTEEANYEEIKSEGRQALDDLEAEVRGLDSQMAARTLEKKMTSVRRGCMARIHEVAIQNGSVSGKWMLFPSGSDVGKRWLKVVEATVAGELGCAAKVGIMGESDGFYPHKETKSRKKETRWAILVYSQDFRDDDDVGRVCKALRDRNIIGARETISYVSDVLTELGLCAGNEWKLPPNKYTSADFTSKRKAVK